MRFFKKRGRRMLLHLINIFLLCQYFLPLKKRRALHLDKNWIPLTQGFFVPNFDEVDPLSLGDEYFKCRQYICPMSLLYPLTKIVFKDEQHPTYVIMLCKRWTSMTSAIFFLNLELHVIYLPSLLLIRVYPLGKWRGLSVNHQKCNTLYPIMLC